jgi:hypothetical protein
MFSETAQRFYAIEQQEQHKEKPGIAFVFANELNEHGEINNETRARTDAALALYNSGEVGTFLVTGGVFQENQPKPVAEPMKEYLIKNGVKEADVLVESRAVDTVANILLGYLEIIKKFSSKEFLKRLEVDGMKEEEMKKEFRRISEERNIYFVSSDYHLNRIKSYLQGNQLYSEDHSFVSPDTFQTPPSMKGAVMEVIARALISLEPSGTGKLTSFTRAGKQQAQTNYLRSQ